MNNDLNSHSLGAGRVHHRDVEITGKLQGQDHGLIGVVVLEAIQMSDKATPGLNPFGVPPETEECKPKAPVDDALGCRKVGKDDTGGAGSQHAPGVWVELVGDDYGSLNKHHMPEHLEEQRHEPHPLPNRSDIIRAGPGDKGANLRAVIKLAAEPIGLRVVVGLTKLLADFGLTIAAALRVALLEIAAELVVVFIARGVLGVIRVVGKVLSQRGDSEVLICGAFATEDLLGRGKLGAAVSASENWGVRGVLSGDGGIGYISSLQRSHQCQVPSLWRRGERVSTRRKSTYSVEEVRGLALWTIKVFQFTVETGSGAATAVEAGQELSKSGSGRHREG